MAVETKLASFRALTKNKSLPALDFTMGRQKYRDFENYNNILHIYISCDP